MDKKGIGITLGTIALVAVPLVIYSLLMSRSAGGAKDAFALCLTQNGAKMYGTYWCSHCLSQKRLFGSSFSKINYIECSLPDGKTQTQECREAGIKAYPTWEFGDGSRREGELSLEALAEKTNCSLEGGESNDE
jgi:hypothetical protein